MRIWINIAFLTVATLGAYSVMTGKVPYAPSWQYYLYQACPWVLLYGSMKAWHRCFTWRRMSAAKNKAPELSRGQHQSSRIKQRTGILEYICFGLFLLAAASILKQLGIANVSWWIG